IHSLAGWGRLRQSGVRAVQFSHRSLNALDLGVVAWLLLGIVSLTWATYRAQAVTDLRVMILEPALFYVILRTSRLDRRAIIRLVDALILAGLVVAIIGLWTFFQGEGVITAEAGTRRLASVYGSPNNVGLFLGRCIPFVLSYLIITTDHSRRILAGIILPIMLVVVMLSQSAGAIFIGVPVAIITVLLLVWRQHIRKIVITVVAAAAGLFLISLQSARFARVLDFTSGTNFFRLRVWQSALNIIHDHPLTGLGLDQFLYAFRSAYILPDAWQEPNLSHPHNLILDFWTRLGFGGVLILVWLQIAFWEKAVRVYRQARTRQNSYLFAIIVGTIGTMANLVSHGLIDNSIFVQDLSLIFVLLLGLVTQLSNISAID
ncbi:MAG: O-antigen ligase family protein, partial [Anaerolineae bacterium]|nr:O-antigen ligase family protein [Anaerolineae bacterium]